MAFDVTLDTRSPSVARTDSAPGDAPLRLGAQGDRVEKLATQLNLAGEQTPVSRTFGPRLAEALRRFQVTQGITPANGILTPSTQKALDAAVQKAARGGWAARASAPPSPSAAAPLTPEAQRDREASATRSADSQFNSGTRGWELEKKRCLQGLSAAETTELNAARSDPKQSKHVPGLTARIGKWLSDETDWVQKGIDKGVDWVEQKDDSKLDPLGHFQTSVVGGLVKGVTQMVTGTVGLVGKGLELTDSEYRHDAGQTLKKLVEHPGDAVKGAAKGIWEAAKENPGDVIGQAASYILPGAIAKVATVGKVAKGAEVAEGLAKEAGAVAKGGELLAEAEKAGKTAETVAKTGGMVAKGAKFLAKTSADAGKVSKPVGTGARATDLGARATRDARAAGAAGGVTAERVAEVEAYAKDAKLVERYRAPPESAHAELVSDLKKMPATGARGQITNAYDKFMASDLLSPAAKERVLKAAAFAKDFTERAGKGGDAALKGFEDSNRLHLEDELATMTDVAKQMGLSPRQAENAYLASLFSDVDKVPGRLSLVTHHEAGARAAAVRLAELFPNDSKRVAEIVDVIKAHQISPPKFFSFCVGKEIEDTAAKSGRALTEVEQKALAGIREKIADPLNPAHLNPARTAIAFTDDERKLLETIGLKEWSVPANKESWAVILADSKSNYGKPPHKIYGNRGPGTIFSSDRTSEDALDSVLGPKGTGADAMSVLPQELRPSFAASLDDARAGVERARQKMDAWLKSQGMDPQNTVYWRGTQLPEHATEAEIETAKRVRAQFEIFLRQEAGL